MSEKSYIVYGYVRVSTENQLENYSIEEQEARITAYCAAKGWQLLHIYTDGGFSGGSTDRPALQQLLRAVRTHPADAVVVYKLDRLSRSQKDTLTLIEDEFLAHKTDFISINENFDTSTPFGRAMIGMLSIFAQLEKDQITERFTMGRIGRCKAGYFHGGANIPLGYRYENGLLQVDEGAAEAVRQVFARFLSGDSLHTIARRMERRFGGRWNATKTANILRNSIYIGKVKFAGQVCDGVHEPLISDQDFYAAGLLLGERGKNTAQKSPFRAKTLLSGLLYCERCGARYAGDHGFYKCYSRTKSSSGAVRDPDCKNAHWPISALDAVVSQAVVELLSPPERLQTLLSAACEAPAANPEALTKRLRELDAQTAKLADLYRLGTLPLSLLSERSAALQREKDALQLRLSAVENTYRNREIRLRQAAERLPAVLEQAPLPARRLLLASLIRAVRLDGQTVKIQWRL